MVGEKISQRQAKEVMNKKKRRRMTNDSHYNLTYKQIKELLTEKGNKVSQV
jgi:uncharacterized protein YneF (UPF0154 family)